MARLRQQNPNNYVSSGNTSAEFESIIRYINAAELGNKTIGELLASIFDESGEWSGPVEMRLDSSNGLQYRVGAYASEDLGWVTLTSLSDVRGPAGADVGTIGAPIFFGRVDYVATSGQTVFAYAHDTDDDILVYVNGILKTPGVSSDYTHDAAADTVTFNSGVALNDKVSFFRVRSTSVTGYTRVDYYTTSTQAVFSFVHDDTTVLHVYKNGILQRFGGSYDYVANPATDTVTFVTPVASGNSISIITVENTATTAVTGLMMEEKFADPATGKILYSKLQIADGDIAQAKVSGLPAALAAGAKLVISNTTPVSPGQGWLWLDTSVVPNVLKFFDGLNWLQTSPDSTLPSFTAADAGKVVQVNGLGSALIYADPDLSSVIPVTQKGAANGVATLDSNGQLPAAQLPSTVASYNHYAKYAGTTANGTYVHQRVFKRKLSLTGATLVCASGTATVQLAINGVGVGPTYSVSSVLQDVTFATAQAVDASTSSVRIGFIVTSASTFTDFEFVVAGSVVT